LEAIFEPEFQAFETKSKKLATNFGFRPQHSCFDAVRNVKQQGRLNSYAIEGDIKGFCSTKIRTNVYFKS
jgi:retron-type reverse transcriptase